MWASKRALSTEQHDAWKTGRTTIESPMGSAWSSDTESEDEDVFVVARMMLGESALSSSGLMENWRTSTEASGTGTATRKARNSAKLKSLQRTPYPMLLNRIRMLLERLRENIDDTGNLNSGMLSKAGGANSAKVSEYSKTGQSQNMTAAPPASSALQASATQPPATTKSSSKEYILSELSLVLGYVSEFLGNVPEETRRSMCSVTKMEHYKKDEIIFNAGDEPDKFFIILTGLVEIAEHPGGKDTGERVSIATLKKGQSFGDHSILNNTTRAATCISIGNSTFLTVGRADFIQVFGPYFFEQKRLAMKFLMKRVNVFKEVSREKFFSLVLYTIKSRYPEGREWDVCKEKYVYFIINGTCTLESVDRRAPVNEPKNAMRCEDIPTVGDSGILANIEVHKGRAVGTLGKEEQIKAIRRSMIPKKVLAKLGSGSWFGGGSRVLGEGDVQSSLKVTAEGPVETYVISVEDLFKFGDPEIVRSIREDACFSLTYFCGRVGVTSVEAVIGHENTGMMTTKANLLCEDLSAKRTTSKRDRKRRISKPTAKENQTHFSQQTENIFKYVSNMRDEIGQEIAEAQYDKGTPAERYWASPNFTNTSAQNRLVPILRYIYSDGFGPLSSKIERLEHRKERQASRKEEDLNWFWDVRGTPPSASPPAASVLLEDESIRNKDTCSRVDDRSVCFESRSQSCVGRPRRKDTQKRRPRSANDRPYKQRGALTAACILWDRASRDQTPKLRQCLTYAEISRNRTDMTRRLFGIAEDETNEKCSLKNTPEECLNSQ